MFVELFFRLLGYFSFYAWFLSHGSLFSFHFCDDMFGVLEAMGFDFRVLELLDLSHFLFEF